MAACNRNATMHKFVVCSNATYHLYMASRGLADIEAERLSLLDLLGRHLTTRAAKMRRVQMMEMTPTAT